MAARSTVMASWTRVAIDAASARGVPSSRVLAGLRVDGEDLIVADGRVPADVDTAVWERAARLSGDDAFATRAVTDHVRPSTFGAVGFVAMTSANLDEAFARSARLHRLVCSDGRFDYRVGRVAELIRLPPQLRWPPVVAEAVLASLVGLARAFSDDPITPLEVRFQHRGRGNAHLEAFFGVAPRFGQPDNALVFSLEQIRRPLRHAQSELARWLDGVAHARLPELVPDHDVVAGTRAAIVAGLDRGDVSLAGIAPSMGLSTRTLQRRLDEHGLVFRDLVEHVRVEQARVLLGEGRPVDEIAERLAFAESGAFRRAFRRSTGESPRQYRERLR